MAKFVSTREACQKTGIHPMTLKKMVDDGSIKRHGRYKPANGGQLGYRYDLAEVAQACLAKGYIDELQAEKLLAEAR